MADDTTKDVLGQAGIWLGGGGALAGLGVLIRGLLNGSLAQEKEIRADLAARNEVLQKERDAAEALERRTRRYRDTWRYHAHQSRLVAEGLAARAGETLPPWPPDPEDP